MNALKQRYGWVINNSLPTLVYSRRQIKTSIHQKKDFSSSSFCDSIMSNLHLSEGSELPALQKGVLRVYNMRFCPYAERTLLVLNVKKIKYELVNVNLKKKPEWFLQKNPYGKVPVLEEDGKILYESLATCNYLDEVYRTPPLYPEDPWARAVDNCFIGILEEKFVTPMTRSYFKLKDPSLIDAAFNDARKGFQLIENEIAKRGTKFLGGSKPGMIDFMIWPWFERLPAVNILAGEEFCLLPKELFPLTINYMKDLEEEKTIQDIKIPLEQHLEFFKGFLSGSPNYDIGIKTFDEDSKL